MYNAPVKMPGVFVHRDMEAVLRRAARDFPGLVLTGPRQSGKTTLLQRLFGRSHGYVTLDDPWQRQLAVRDPELFLPETTTVTFTAPAYLRNCRPLPVGLDGRGCRG